MLAGEHVYGDGGHTIEATQCVPEFYIQAAQSLEQNAYIANGRYSIIPELLRFRAALALAFALMVAAELMGTGLGHD